MERWATEYLATKIASTKQAGPFMSGALGGLPYALGERAALKNHPEMSQEDFENLPNQFMRIPTAHGRSIPRALLGGLGGGLLGAGVGALTGHDAASDLINGGVGAASGAALGGFLGHHSGMYSSGRDLAEEEIAQQGTPEIRQKTLFDRHPVAMGVGLPLSALQAAGSLNPASLALRGASGGLSSAISSGRLQEKLSL